jgi:putative hydrolase of the HAD superfamily
LIKAVIFDYGNVISLPYPRKPYEEMEKLTAERGCRIPARVFPRAYDKFSAGFDRGDYDGATMYAMHLEAEGYAELARDRELMERIARIDMETWQYVDEEVSAWVKELKGRGFAIGILSNMPREFLDAYGDRVEAFKIADYACFSCDVALIKPEREIYLRVLSRLGVEAGEAVFFDDVRKNVDAAVEAGIHAFLWTGLEAAKKKLYTLIMAENKLTVGLSAEKSEQVDETNVASSVGCGVVSVFSTPRMILLMETAAASAAAPALEKGFSTVGTEVCIKHLAATLPGGTVTARATLTAINGKILTFSVEAFDDDGKIGEGTHTRAIIENEKFLARLKQKSSSSRN